MRALNGGGRLSSLVAAVRRTLNDHDAASLRGSCLGPIDRVLVEAHQVQPMPPETIRSEVIGDFQEP